MIGIHTDGRRRYTDGMASSERITPAVADERRDQRRHFGASAANGFLGAVFLIVTALATAAVVSLLIFAIAAMAVPFLPHVAAAVAGSAAILLLVKWIGRCADSPKAMWITVVRVCGGVIVTLGVIVVLLARAPGAERAIAVGVGVLFVLIGAAIVVTHPRVKPRAPTGETRPNSDSS
jgi:hypothetical protein